VYVIRSLCGTRVRVEHATGKVRPKPWLRRGGGGMQNRAPSPRPVRRSYENDRERCAYCGERGHPSYDCPRERRGRRRFDVFNTTNDANDDDICYHNHPAVHIGFFLAAVARLQYTSNFKSCK